MAEEKEDEIILEVKVDEEAVEKKIIDLRKQVVGLKADKEKLRAENKAGTITLDAYATGMTKTNLAINAANKSIRENERTIERATIQQQAASGSLVQLRAQLSLLTADFDNLSEAERNNEEIGGVLKDRINDITDVLKEQEVQTGRTYRLVGDYAGAIEGAITGNNTWTGRLRDTAASLKQGKENLTQYIQGLKGSTEGMNGAQKASVGLGLGLKAIGIGLLLQAIAGLIAFLSKMDAGMDKVEQATAALSAGFENLIQTIAPIGEAIVDAFTHPLDSIVNFGKALLHPIDSINSLIDGSKNLADEITTNVGKAAAAAVDYTKAMQDLGDEQDGLIAQQARVNAQVAKALLSTKDRSKTERERIKLLDEAGKAELDLANTTVSIRQRELDALVKFQKSKKELQDADRVDLQKAQAAVINAQAETDQTAQQIQNRRSALREQEAAEVKAAADRAEAAAKKRAENLLAIEERKLLTAKQQGKETLAFEESVIRAQLKLDLVGLGKNSEQRKLLVKKAEVDIAAVKLKSAQDTADRVNEIEQSRISAQLLLAQKGSQKELELQKKALTDQLDFDKARAVDTIKNEQQLTARLRLLDAKYNSDTEQLDENFKRAQIDRANELAGKRLETEINLSKETFLVQLDNQRKQIDQEEKHGLALLKLDEDLARERGQLDEQLQSDLLVRQSAIQSKAIAARRQLAQQEAERDRQDAIALAEAKVIAANDGSFKELKARKELLRKQRDNEIVAAKENTAEIARIKASFRDQEEKLDTDFNTKLAEQILSTASLVSSGLSTLYEYQAKAATNVLDKQQADALRSAGTNADLRSRIDEQYQKKREALEKEAARKRKRIASIENVIQTASAGTAALKLFAENPVLGAITELLILAKAAANQKLIDQQAFAYGGTYLSDGKGAVIKGPGTAQSDSINSRLSNGESVLTADATAMFYDELSAMNVLGGGRPFPQAGDVQIPQMGFAFGGVPKSNDNSLLEVVDAIAKLNILVNVTDINRVNDDLTMAKAIGDY